MKNKNLLKKIICILLFIIFFPMIIITFLIKGIIKANQKAKWKKSGDIGKKLLINNDITKVDLMEGYEFEEYLRALFFYAGYDAKVTQKSKDFGADLILEKNDQVIVVQAKRYNKSVGAKSVQEIFSAKEHYKATDASVVTNSYFSPQAEQLAKELGVRLIDRDELIEMVKSVTEIIGEVEIDTDTDRDFYNNPNKFAI